MKLKKFANHTKNYIRNNASSILTWVGVAGVASTVYITRQDTLKAEDAYWEARESSDTPVDYWRTTWRCYIPTAISAAGTIGCILGAHYCSAKQTEAITSAYLTSQATLHEYQRKVIERIGPNKERELHDEVIKEVANQTAPAAVYSQGMVDAIETGHGKTLFYDVPGDVYFKSDMQFLRSKVNDINYELRSEMIFDWNELYYRWGLPARKYGSEMIFDVDHPLEPRFVPEMMEDGQVRINIDYELYPRQYSS